MRNDQVIEAFLKGETKGRSSNGNLYIHLKNLVNYNTTIAEHLRDGIIALNVKKYSSTTSTIQNKIRKEAQYKGLQVVEYNPDVEGALVAYKRHLQA